MARILSVGGWSALITLLILQGAAHAQEDVFLMPDAFATLDRRTPITVAITSSSNFPNLGAAPAGIAGTPWRGSAYRFVPNGEGYYTIGEVGSDERATRFQFVPDRRGWVSVGVHSNSEEERVLEGAERDAFLDSLYLTPVERADYQRPAGSIRVRTGAAAHAFICVSRCDAPEVTTGRDRSLQANPASGPRAFRITTLTGPGGRITPAEGLTVTLVSRSSRLTVVAGQDGGIVVPEEMESPVLLTYQINRPPRSSLYPYYSERVESWTLTVPFETIQDPRRAQRNSR